MKIGRQEAFFRFDQTDEKEIPPDEASAQRQFLCT